MAPSPTHPRRTPSSAQSRTRPAADPSPILVNWESFTRSDQPHSARVSLATLDDAVTRAARARSRERLLFTSGSGRQGGSNSRSGECVVRRCSQFRESSERLDGRLNRVNTILPSSSRNPSLHNAPSPRYYDSNPCSTDADPRFIQSHPSSLSQTDLHPLRTNDRSTFINPHPVHIQTDPHFTDTNHSATAQTTPSITHTLPRTSSVNGRSPTVVSAEATTRVYSPSTSATPLPRLINPSHRRKASLTSSTSGSSSHHSYSPSTDPALARPTNAQTLPPGPHRSQSSTSSSRSYFGPSIPSYNASSSMPTLTTDSNTHCPQQPFSSPRSSHSPVNEGNIACARRRELPTIVQITVVGNADFGQFPDNTTIDPYIGNTLNRTHVANPSNPSHSQSQGFDFLFRMLSSPCSSRRNHRFLTKLRPHLPEGSTSQTNDLTTTGPCYRFQYR